MSRTEVVRATSQLRALRSEWNALADTPFLTVDWLAAWFDAFGRRPLAVLRRNEADALVAVGAFDRHPARLVSATNVYSSDWDVLAAGPDDRCRIWRDVAAVAPPRLVISALREERASAARAALAAAGYDVVVDPDLDSPVLRLPSSYDELLSTVSRTMRQQVRRRARTLGRQGRVGLRTNRGGAAVDADLDAFVRIEGSGWKRRAGTALADRPRAQRCFRSFARAAGGAGWLRLRFLELDGVPVAADLSCVYAGAEWLLKTGYDERYRALRPGFVLRAEALRAAIEEGVARYEFLGGPEPYKLRWTGDLERRVVLRAHRGLARPLSWWARGRHQLHRRARQAVGRPG